MYYLGSISLFFTNSLPKFLLVFWSLNLSFYSTATSIDFQSSCTDYNTFWRFFLGFCSQFISNLSCFSETDSWVVYPPPLTRLFCCFNSLQLLIRRQSNWFKSFILIAIWAFLLFLNHLGWGLLSEEGGLKAEVDFLSWKRDNLSNWSSNSSQ